MTKPLHVQIKLPADAATVFTALTDPRALERWFVEHADVALPERRYDFWGRFTPETPSRPGGRHEIARAVPGRRLSYTWHLRGALTSVDLRIVPAGKGTLLAVWHRDVPDLPREAAGAYAMEDFWYLTLENLRRHVTGRAPVRCDFSAIRPGDIRHSVDIAAPRAAVWEALIAPKQLERWIASQATVDARQGGVWDLGWGTEGALRILELDPERVLALAWEVDGKATVVTWTLDGSGGRTRLTIVHSGFGLDERIDGLHAGWLNFISWIKSMVEFGSDWVPAIKEISKASALYYASTIWAGQEELLGEDEVDEPHETG